MADAHLYLPFDLTCLVRKAIQSARPSLILLSESDMWWNFLRLAKQGGAIIALVSGKISERSARRFHRFPWFSRSLFALFDCIGVQNSLYQDRFLQAGAKPSTLHITGNLKFDSPSPQPLEEGEKRRIQERLCIDDTTPLLLIASTHDPEEKSLFPILKELWCHFPLLKVILAPRHPERIPAICTLLKEAQIAYSLDSQQETLSCPLLLVDRIGVLHPYFSLAHIAVIGGSFFPGVGGHNVLEPCEYALPVLFGPFMSSQPDLPSLLLNSHAGLQIPIEQLAATLTCLLQSTTQRQQMGESGKRLSLSLKGSLQRTFDALQPHLLHLNS
jgi:3-deoxy-D-manno-octulosonic-acid transferase